MFHYYICNTCKNIWVFRSRTKYCPNIDCCEHKGENEPYTDPYNYDKTLYDIDEFMVKPIKEFLQLGYRTLFSCQGHNLFKSYTVNYDTSTHPYLLLILKKNDKKFKRLKEILNDLVRTKKANNTKLYSLVFDIEDDMYNADYCRVYLSIKLSNDIDDLYTINRVHASSKFIKHLENILKRLKDGK